MRAAVKSAEVSDQSEADVLQALHARCRGAPADPRMRIALARALLAAARPAEALIFAEQALALAPGLADAQTMRRAVVEALEAGDPRLTTLELSAALDPDDGGLQLALGEAYAAAARPRDAERLFKRALGLGRAREAHADLAALYLSVGMAEAAEHHANAALASADRGPPDDAATAMACQTLAKMLEARGEIQAAAARLDLAYQRQSLFRQPAAGAEFTTLVLVSRRAGNIPYAELAPHDRFDRLVWYMEHARLEQLASAPPFAAVLNAIGDPDAGQASLGLVRAVTAQCGRPVLNPPSRVQATRRDRLAETLAGVADIVVPQTVRIEAGAANRGDLAARLAAASLVPPLLLRPAGSHGGAGLVLAESEEALACLDLPGGHALYASRFHDYRSADGYFRKYRAIFVNRRAFPYHLAIGRHWMVHHLTSEMAEDAMRKAEEMRFLADPAAVLGARAMAAVETIGERLGLDYAGLDFSLTHDGRVLVFEANATMLTHLEAEDGPFAAKNRFIRPIIEAFQAHLARLALGTAA